MLGQSEGCRRCGIHCLTYPIVPYRAVEHIGTAIPYYGLLTEVKYAWLGLNFLNAHSRYKMKVDMISAFLEHCN
jgi:hypothetical protein